MVAPAVPPVVVAAARTAALAGPFDRYVPAPLRSGPFADAAASAPPVTWVSMSAAMLFGIGWVLERRKRRGLEVEKDSVMWADVQLTEPSVLNTHQSLDEILPDSPDPAESARAIYVSAIGDTTSRREATLIDLHQLDGKITRRRQRGDLLDAVLLLQQHLVDFRYTSPWAFLELRELYKMLGRQTEWEVARVAFRNRFGQNAPAWDQPSTEKTELADDAGLCDELTLTWPYREARLFFLRWLLGDPRMRQKGMGPPLLPLGVCRDLLFLDTMLDDVIRAKQDRVDTGMMGLEITE